MDDLINRQAAIDAMCFVCGNDCDKSKFVYNAPQDEQVIMCPEHYVLSTLPSVQPEEVIPHRNYKYLSDYWCECGNHLGKKGDVKYCSDCGKKVKWDECI